METIKKYYRVERSQIAFIRFTFEAYDGLANVTTINSDRGVIRLAVAPGCEADADAVIKDLKRDILIEPEEGHLSGSGQR